MKYKTLTELKQELGDKFEQFLYESNIELLNQKQKAIDYINNTNFWGIYEDISFKETKYGDDLLEILKEE